jgi:peptidoglycan-binding protein ArfA
MAGSGEDRTIAEWRTDSRLYRRRPGLGWLIALIAVPLLLALIGWGATGRSAKTPEVALPSVNPSATLTVPAASPSASPTAEAGGQFGAMSIVRTGKGFTLTGEVPDDATKASLPDTIRQAMPGATIVDNLTVKPGVKAPEFAGLGALFGAAIDVTDFGANLVGDTVTLTGTADSEEAKAAAESAAKATWPNVMVVNNINVTAASASSSAPAPAPAPAGACSSLQADITDLLKTPINFDTDGFTLAPASAQVVAQIADKVKACPGSKLAVVGYTDNTGNDAINVPLSTNRAKAVADALVSDGLTAPDVASSGEGSANPIADNGTPAGRAQNRRVEITVS